MCVCVRVCEFYSKVFAFTFFVTSMTECEAQIEPYMTRRNAKQYIQTHSNAHTLIASNLNRV